MIRIFHHQDSKTPRKPCHLILTAAQKCLTKISYIIFLFISLQAPQAKALDQTLTPTVTETPTPKAARTPTPVDTFQFDLSSKITKADVTVIPNPAYGDKVSFRVMAPAKSLVRIRIYNHNLEGFAKIEKEGEKVFDILWNLKEVPEGLYYYQTQIVDDKTGKITHLPLSNFAVMK